MKDKKNRLLWVDRLRVGFIIGMLLAGMMAYAGSIVCLIGMFVILIAWGMVELTMNRCPHCDRYLDRNWGPFCQYCGERVREDKSET